MTCSFSGTVLNLLPAGHSEAITSTSAVHSLQLEQRRCPISMKADMFMPKPKGPGHAATPRVHSTVRSHLTFATAVEGASADMTFLVQ